MRALVLSAPAPIETAPLRLEARPTPSPEAGEILVRVGACGVCRTDLHIVEGELDEDHHRNSRNGWRVDGLPWEQY